MSDKTSDTISRQAAIDALNGLIDRFEQILRDIRETNGDDSVCGMCEYDGAYIGQSGDWCNECPGFDKDDCFKLSDECRKRWLKSVNLPSAQPERKQGKWIECNPQNSDTCRLIECDQCGFSHIVGFNVPYEHWIENRNFCERCGADMRGEQDE